MSFIRSLLFQCLILGLLFIQSVRSDCYYPDGSNATDYTYVPCKSGNGFSSCCIPSEGDVCLSNGLCYYDSAPYPFRGACTDPTFKSEACPKYCVSNNPESWQSLTSCGGTKWCCSDILGCCSKPNLVFDIGVPSVINDYGSAKPYHTLSLQPTTGQRTIITAAVTGANGAVATNGAAASATGAFPTGTPSANSQPPSSSSHTGLVIGIAAGVVVFLVLMIGAAIVVFCLVRRKRNNQRPAAPVNLIDMNPSGHPQGAYAASTTQLVHKPSVHQPEKPWGEPAPAYTPPHWQQTPVNPHGQTLIELQTPPMRQTSPNGQHVYEMHG